MLIPDNVTRTGGGAFDRSDRHHYFLASGMDSLAVALDRHRFLLVAVNELTHDGDLEKLDELIGRGANVLLDSGIFALAMEHARKHGVSHDEALNLPPEEVDGFPALMDRYLALVERYESRLWGYIELDLGGAVNKRRTRAKLEGLGLRPIPVYHPFGDGFTYFDELAGSYDRICLGNIVRAGPGVRTRLLATLAERKRQYPWLWIHVLGLSLSQTSNAYPMESSDSSSWLESLRWIQGYRERVACQNFSEMPVNYRYALGDIEGHNKATGMAAYGAHFYEANWRGLMDAYAKAGL